MENAARAGPTDVHLELGGKSAMLVFDDVEDVAATVDWACVGIFSNSGQVCRQAWGGWARKIVDLVAGQDCRGLGGLREVHA